MNNKIDSFAGEYYPNKMFFFTIPYFVLNLLDFITTRIALTASENLYELNPFYYHPLLASLKLFAPLLLLALYLDLYYFNKSAQGKRIIGKCGLYCVVALTGLYSIICINNVCQGLWSIV